MAPPAVVITRGREAAKPANPLCEGIAAPYIWTPCQHAYSTPTVVGTMTLDMKGKAFEKGSFTSQMLRLEPHFQIRGRDRPWCHLLKENLVVCKGSCFGLFSTFHDPENGRSMKIGRMPTGCRPNRPLHFAAVLREAFGVPRVNAKYLSYGSQLIVVTVTPEGWILGTSKRDCEGYLDLSCIRFSVTKGIALVDDVTLHSIDTGSGRVVMLQGSLEASQYNGVGGKPIANLPDWCRPAASIQFVTAGSCQGGYHLVGIQPSDVLGQGGDIMWQDSVWRKDQVHLSGVLFEVEPETYHKRIGQHNAVHAVSPQLGQALLKDFQLFLLRRFGTIQDSWDKAFDLDDSGAVNFTEFSRGCKFSGYMGNPTKIWQVLDSDGSGEITVEELAHEPEVSTAASSRCQSRASQRRPSTATRTSPGFTTPGPDESGRPSPGCTTPGPDESSRPTSRSSPLPPVCSRIANRPAPRSAWGDLST